MILLDNNFIREVLKSYDRGRTSQDKPNYHQAERFIRYISQVYERAKQAENNYVVLMCRRCLIVFCLISFICCKYDPKEYKRILCDDDLLELNKNSNAFVVDDIIIHGRTVSRLCQELDERSIKFRVSAFQRSIDANCLSKRVTSSYDYLEGSDVNEIHWHTFSNKLIDLIIKCRIPYTTFTYSFIHNCDDTVLKFNNFEKFEQVPQLYANDSQKLTVYFDTNYIRFPLLKLICRCACIREYSSSKESGYIHIPFVFIDVIDCTLFPVLAVKAKKYLPQSVCDVFSSSKYDLEYKTRLLSFLLSYCYGCVSLDIDSINANLDVQRTEIVKSIVSKSFRTTFDDVLAISLDKCRSFLNLELSLQSEDTADPNEMDQIFGVWKYNAQLEQLSDERYAEVIEAAISELHRENEARAIERQESLCGYKLSDILISLTPNKSIYLVLSSMISLWDTGKASYYFKERGNKVYGCITDGEQAYRIEYQQCVPYAYSIMRLKGVLSFCKNPSALMHDYFKMLKESAHEIGLPVNYQREFEIAQQFLEDKSLLELKLGLGETFKYPDFSGKLNERTEDFLSSTLYKYD